MGDCEKADDAVKLIVEEAKPAEDADASKDTEKPPPATDVIECAEEVVEKPEIEEKPETVSEKPSESEEKEVREVQIEAEKPAEEVDADDPPPLTIEECDTGGDEVPDVSEVPEPIVIDEKPEEVPIVVQEAEKEDPEEELESEPVKLTELTTVTEQVHEVESSIDKSTRSEIVAIDDDDDDVEDGDGDASSDDDIADDDEDEDDDGASNEATNDEDEEPDFYDDDEKKAVSEHPPHPGAYSDEEYDDDEDDDALHSKDDSNAAVVIESSDDEVIEHKKPAPASVKKHQQQMQQQQLQEQQRQQQAQPTLRKYMEDFVDDVIDDDDDYDDDELMNMVVTSASKNMPSTSSSSSAQATKSMTTASMARKREAEQIDALSRKKNIGRIIKRKCLNWYYNKRKREIYKRLLPSRLPSTTVAAAMRSDQSGGLLHLNISQPSVSSLASKHLIKPSSSTAAKQRADIRSSAITTPSTSTPQTPSKSECVIDIDSSPEKSQDNVSPRNHTDDQRISDTTIKKPPDNQDKPIDPEHSTIMQQTDKVRDSIQKSTEEVVEEVKSATTHLTTSEQNKENLQSNEALQKDITESESKHETPDPKERTTSEEPMDTADDAVLDAAESTLIPSDRTSASPLKRDIKEEKQDTTTSTQKTTEETAVSKVTIEDVQETDQPHLVTPPQPSSTGAPKRRRSSSATSNQESKSKIPKQTTKSTSDQPDLIDDDEEYIHPTKKLREELQCNYPSHDRILTEYIEKTSNDSVDTIQRHIEQMLSEIQTLNEMIKAKEVEWNNMLHLKKVKEEICFRLTRRKQCMEIMTTKVGEASQTATGLEEEYLANESVLGIGKTPQSLPNNPQLSSTPIATGMNNLCNFTGVSSSSSMTTNAPTTAQMLIQNRANMKSSDLAKENATTQRLHRNILPKPTASPSPSAVSTPIANQQNSSANGPTASSSTNQPILNSYLTSADSVQQLVDMMNGHHNHTALLNGVAGAGGNNAQGAAMFGRQGPVKDVRSIIADYRQQHPEVVPRRGRRNSRPSSNDSSSHSMSNTNQAANNHNTVNTFKDVLAPFAKSQGAASLRSAGGQQQNPPYPEVTLHPVSTPLNASGGQDQPTGSLLHGILTKFSRPHETTKSVGNQTSSNYISNFSPTLARLLTAPERISTNNSGVSGNQGHHGPSGSGESVGGPTTGAHHAMSGFGVNLSKVVGHNSEITITPVMNSMHQQSMLQQQLQQQQLKDVLTRAAAAVGCGSAPTVKDEHFLKLSSFAAASAGNNDDDAEDSVDRLVIDEGVDSMVGGDEQRIAPQAIGQEFNENEVPVCQGCKKHEAQFVCAGCGNQWYCSRECQVTAWDDHSEVCTATKQIRNKFNILKSRDLEREDEYYIVRRRKRNKFFPQFY